MIFNLKIHKDISLKVMFRKWKCNVRHAMRKKAPKIFWRPTELHFCDFLGRTRRVVVTLLVKHLVETPHAHF
jgi:hypothetical protein